MNRITLDDCYQGCLDKTNCLGVDFNRNLNECRLYDSVLWEEQLYWARQQSTQCDFYRKVINCYPGTNFGCLLNIQQTILVTLGTKRYYDAVNNCLLANILLDLVLYTLQYLKELYMFSGYLNLFMGYCA